MTGDEIESLKRTAAARIGTAKIALENLHYPHCGDHARLQNDSNVARLFKNFQNDSCRRESPENHIKAAISSDVLQSALQRSRCSEADLQPTDPPFLVLAKNEMVTCFEGQHRLAAASRFFSSETPDDRWWTVILYNDNVLTDYDRERMWHAREDSSRLFDGEIVWNIRTRQIGRRYLDIGKWVSTLHSRSKHNDLNRLQSQQFQLVWKALDRLLPFRGLWAVEFFASCRRIFRIKCPEILASYIGHIADVWEEIFRGVDPKYLDPRSVELLEGRSPQLSRTDRRRVMAASNELFARVLDPEIRELLISRCLQPNKGILIPSLRTFNEDTKYIEPAAIALRKLVPERFKGSLFEALKLSGSWQDGEDFWPRYRRLWLFALRYFPSMTDIRPLLDESQAKKADINSDALNGLAQLAAKEGFMTREIQVHLLNGSSDVVDQPSSAHPELTQDITTRWSKTHNCGKPYWSAFREIFPYMHLEYIETDYRAKRLELTPFAVARSIFRIFLGISETCDTDMVSSCYSVQSQVIELNDKQPHDSSNVHPQSALQERALAGASGYAQLCHVPEVEMLSEQDLIIAPQQLAQPQLLEASNAQQTGSISPAQNAPQLLITNGYPRQLESARPSEVLNKYSNHIVIDYDAGQIWAFAENDDNRSFREYVNNKATFWFAIMQDGELVSVEIRNIMECISNHVLFMGANSFEWETAKKDEAPDEQL